MLTTATAISLIILIHVIKLSALQELHEQKQSRFVIAGYWPDYRSYVDINKSSSSMTDLILFSIEPTDDGIIQEDFCCLSDDTIRKAKAAKNINSSLNLLVSVGGAGRSAAFAIISRDEMKRKSFAQELKRFCLREGLNGVDFDWEQPSTRDEYISYINLLIESSIILHKEGLLITIALHPDQFLPKEVYDHLDKIHLMTYDMVVQAENHHSSFKSSFKAVESLIDSGCDPAKIVLGLPAYSRSKKNPSLVKTFSEIVDLFIQENGVTQNQNNYLVKLNNFHDFELESELLVKRKIEELVVKGLAGVFIWEMGQDYRSAVFPSGLLLHHILEAFDTVDKEQDDEL